MPQILEEYNERHNSLHLVLFDDALEHLTRVHRVLRMQKGHVMIVGVGGSGKQSMLRLAAFAAGNERAVSTLATRCLRSDPQADSERVNASGIRCNSVVGDLVHCNTYTRHPNIISKRRAGAELINKLLKTARSLCS